MMSSSNIPELAALSSEDRKIAWKFAYQKLLLDWIVWIGFLVVGLCTGTGYLLAEVFGSALGAGIGGYIFMTVLAARGRPHIQQWCKENSR